MLIARFMLTQIRMLGTVLEAAASFIFLLIQTFKSVALLKAMSSASAIDAVTIDCFLDFHDTARSKNKYKNTVANF